MASNRGEGVSNKGLFSKTWRRQTRRGLFARRQLDSWVLLVATVLLLFLFWVLEPKWLNQDTFQLLVARYAPLALVSVAMTFSIIAGHIDLSPGSMIGLAGAVMGLVFTWSGNLWLSLLAGLGTAVGVGLLHSAFVAGLGINAIMVTLGTYIWARGLANGANAGTPILVGGGISRVVNASWAGFTLTAPVVVVAYLGGALLLRRTRLGRYTYAMGGGQLSAKRAGINVGLYTTGVFMLMAAMIAAATFIVVGQLGSAAASAGSGMELDSDHRCGYRREQLGRWYR